MANINGTNLSAAVVPFTTEDTYATHYAKYGNGGWKSVENYEDLDTITNDRLEKGMAVYVNSQSKTYILTALDLSSNPVIKTWTELETGGQTIQVSELPEATQENEGQIVEYIGATQSSSTFEVVNTTTTNPVTVVLNKDAFETFIIENLGEEYLGIIAQAPITLNYNYIE